MIAAVVATWRRHRWLADFVGIGVIVLVALIYLSPALKDGFSFGPADLGAQASYLTRGGLHAPIHNSLEGDIIDQDVPWYTLDWRIVHQGSLPLWDSDTGTGLPQLFNFESAPLALPSLIGYLFPVSAAFLVSVLGKLLIAGIGTYVCCRVLRAGAIGATFGGITFMLSGAFTAWLGWALGGPVAWSGFVVAGVILAYRSRRRVRDLWLLALVVAFAVYGGFPEEYILMGAVLTGVMAVAALGIYAADHRLAARGLARVAAGIAAGFGLSAPLWLPGISLLAHSARFSKLLDQQFPLHVIASLFAQGYYGLPIAGSVWFGPSNYVETATYVGVIALALAGVAVFIAWRRPIVAGLGLGAVGCVFVAYRVGGAYVARLVTDLGLSALPIHRILIVLAFLLAVLGGLGCDIVVKRFDERPVQVVLGAATAVLAAVVAGLWLTVGDRGLTTLEQSLRRSSLLWPSATIGLLGVVWAAAFYVRRLGPPARRRAGALVGAALISGQAAFLVFASVGINSYFTTSFPMTPEVRTVQRIVGSDLVASDAVNVSCAKVPDPTMNPCGIRLWLGIGFIPNIQLGYGIDELAMHDPTIPESYFLGWPVPDAGQIFAGNLQFFTPSINSLALARRYGVGYVLIGPGLPVPAGMTAVTRIPVRFSPGAYLILARVPDAPRFTFTAATGDEVVSARHPDDASYVLSVRVPHPSKLVLRVTCVPGWHVTADGRPLDVRCYEGAFLAVQVPAGTHTIVARYWPRDFTIGIVFALLALLALVLAPFFPKFWRIAAAARSRPRRGATGRPAGSSRPETPGAG